jgi:hypothetical protein
MKCTLKRSLEKRLKSEVAAHDEKNGSDVGGALSSPAVKVQGRPRKIVHRLSPHNVLLRSPLTKRGAGVTCGSGASGGRKTLRSVLVAAIGKKCGVI